MSITLSIPPVIVQEVRDWAEKNGTSLNQYIRDCLAAKCAELQEERKRVGRAFMAFARTHQIDAPKGWRWSRDEATARAMGCLA